MAHPDWPWPTELGNPHDIANAIYRHPDNTPRFKKEIEDYAVDLRANKRKVYSAAVEQAAREFQIRHGLIAEKAKETK
jgi:hypothetical protein